MYNGLHVKYTLFWSDFNESWTFSSDYRKIFQHQISKSLSSGSLVVARGRTDKQTDMTKLIVAFRNFVNPPKHGSLLVPVGYNRLYRPIEKHNKIFYDT
jgi:hypothetical protein